MALKATREIFQSTLPTRGSDNSCSTMHKITNISIHAPHEGERRARTTQQRPHTRYFNPRSPRGGATHLSLLAAPKGGFQSTLPTRGSDRALPMPRLPLSYFNPRSPRGGATRARNLRLIHPSHFNPRSPRGGATCAVFFLLRRKMYFNPRSPRGGATDAIDALGAISNDFNPRSPRGGATTARQIRLTGDVISIHAPHEGERPFGAEVFRPRQRISIHAPHEGERRDRVEHGTACGRISIHAPHEGERRLMPTRQMQTSIFQSTLPTRGSDWEGIIYQRIFSISIHAPHEGERRR